MKQRILIMDDDKLLNKINEKVLFSAGLVSELHTASNGLEGIDYLTDTLQIQTGIHKYKS